MYPVIGAVLLSVIVAIGPLNKFVFKTVNVDEIKREGRQRLGAVTALLSDQKYQIARDSLDVIIRDFEGSKEPFSLFIVQTAMYYKGTSYSSEWQYDESIRILNALVKKYPETPYAEQVFFSNGKSFKEINQYRSAIKEFEKIEKNRHIAKDFPKYKLVALKPDQYYNIDQSKGGKKNLSRVYTREMQTKESKGDTTEAGQGDLLTDAVIEIAECHLKLNEMEQARAQASLIRDFFPSSDRVDYAQKLIAESFIKDGDISYEKAERSKMPEEKEKYLRESQMHYKRAVHAFQLFVNSFSQSDLISEAYIALGDVLQKVGKNEDADRSFASAISAVKETEKQAKVQLDIGNYFEESGKWDAAIGAYAKVLENFSKSKIADQAVYMTGVCYESKGDTAKAIEYFANLCEFYKNSTFLAPSAYKLGLNYQNLKDYKKSLEYYRLGVDLGQTSPVVPEIQYHIGLLFMERKEFETAVKEFQYVVDQYEGSEYVEKSYYQMVDCYKRMGNMEQAKESALKIKSNNELIIESYKLLGLGVSTPEEELELWKKKFEEAVSNNAKAAALMEIGRIQLYNLQQLDSAYQSYQRVLELTEDETRKVNANVNIAQIYVNQEKYEDARTLYEEILNNPKSHSQVKVQVKYKIFDTYRREKQYEKAREGFLVFLEDHRAHDLGAYAQFALGVCYTEEKKHEKALAEYLKVIDEFPESDVFGQAVLAVGSAHRSLGNLDVAVDYWLKMLKDHPGLAVMPQIYMQIGSIYKEQKKFDKAIYYLKSVVDDFPDFPMISTVAYLLGESYSKQGKDRAAIEAFELVKQEDLDIKRAADAEMGRLLGKTNPAAAIACYERIIGYSTEDAHKAVAEMGKGDIYTGMGGGNLKKAAESFHKIYDEYREASDTLRGAALVKEIDAYNQLRNYNKVIELSNAMIKEFPDNPYMINAVYFKASAFYSTDRYVQARRVFQEIIKLNKSEQITEVAYFQRADCLLFMQEYEKAISEYRIYLKKYPKGDYRAFCVYQMGNSYWQMEDFKNAKTQYQQVVNKYPGFSEVCSAKGFLGYCLDQMGDWQTARKLYRGVLKSGKCKGESRVFAQEQLEKNLIQH